MRWWPLALLALSLSAAQAPAAQPSAAGPGVTLTREPGLSAPVRAALRGLPSGVRVGVLAQDLSSGRVLEALAPDTPLIPASTLKLVTAAAVLAERGGAEGWWSSELTVPAAQLGRPRVKAVTLRGSGDPTLSVAQGPYSLRALARQAYARGLREVGEVRLDDARVDPESWRGAVIGVPMTALRLAEWREDPPPSAAEARARLAAALIRELRRAGIAVRSEGPGQATVWTPYVPPPRVDERGQPLPPDPVIPPSRRPEPAVASVRSAPPAGVLGAMLRPSDNLLAEELLSTLAGRGWTGRPGTLASAAAAERALLARLSVDPGGLVLADGSGLSRESRLTPRALVTLLRAMYDLPYPLPGPPATPQTLYRTRRNAFIDALPQAGTGEVVPGHGGRGGTLAGRLVGAGLDVRAKTGTLPGVSALAGYLTARGGRPVAFAIVMNGPGDAPILTLRAVQDDLVRALSGR